MNDLDTLALASGADIARAFARGDASPVELTEFLLDRIAAQTSPVFLQITRERACREAEAAEKRIRAGHTLSPLDGVPVAWKDLIDMAGEVTTAASDVYRTAEPAVSDAPIVANATAAGMVSLGKLNLTEFAYSGLGLNPHFGTPCNPHSDIPRSPGGSSSGSGVSVAAGMAPIAIGTDTGGSVRIPAAFNGIVGYKSSENRIGKTGVFPLSSTLDTVGPLARSVEDCVLSDAVLRGAVTSDVRRAPVQNLKILVPRSIVFDEIEDEVAANFEYSLERLAMTGATIRHADCPAFQRAYELAAEIGTITAAEAYATHRALVDGSDVGRIDARVLARIDLGKKMIAGDYIRLFEERRALQAMLSEQLDGWFMAMPTAPHVAPEIAPLEADEDLFHRINLKTLRNTAIGNFLNLPGVAIPSGVDSAGMPTSFLLSGEAGDDDRLLGYALTAEPVIRG
ncbi:MAG: amidase [Arenibacterium sp.]